MRLDRKISPLQVPSRGVDYSRFDAIDTSGSEEEEDDYDSDDDCDEESDEDSASGDSPESSPSKPAKAAPSSNARSGSSARGSSSGKPPRPLFVDCPAGYLPLLQDKFWGLPGEFVPEIDLDLGAMHRCVGTADGMVAAGGGGGGGCWWRAPSRQQQQRQ